MNSEHTKQIINEIAEEEGLCLISPIKAKPLLITFEEKKLADNVNAVLDAIGRGKIARVTLSPTMGPGVKIALT